MRFEGDGFDVGRVAGSVGQPSERTIPAHRGREGYRHRCQRGVNQSGPSDDLFNLITAQEFIARDVEPMD